jgi:Nucleotidyl transferase AbiEii toxin, Type IV TA system
MHPKVLTKSSWQVVRQLVSRGVVDSWTLAGGTSLALQLGHRFSEDLDFFRIREFDVDLLINKLADISDIQIQTRTSDTLHVLLDGLRISFLHSEVPLLFPGTRYRGMVLADPRDIAVMKLIAIGGRGSRKDFVDLYFVMQGGISIEEILQLTQQRFLRVDYNEYHLLKSLSWFEDAEAEPMPEMIRHINWEEVRKTIEDNVKMIS